MRSLRGRRWRGCILLRNGFDAPRRKPQPLVASFTIFAEQDPAAALERYLQSAPVLASNDAVRGAANRHFSCWSLFMRSSPLLPALRSLWTHNDLHASNLLWS